MVLKNEEILKACFPCLNDYNRFMQNGASRPVLKALDLLRYQIKKHYEKTIASQNATIEYNEALRDYYEGHHKAESVDEIKKAYQKRLDEIEVK